MKGKFEHGKSPKSITNENQIAKFVVPFRIFFQFLPYIWGTKYGTRWALAFVQTLSTKDSTLIVTTLSSSYQIGDISTIERLMEPFIFLNN